MADCIKSTCCEPNPYDYAIDSGTPEVPPVAMFQVTLDVDPDSSGTTSGGGIYTQGTYATITATPSVGFQFVNWTGDFADTQNPAQVFIDNDKTITANFIAATVSLGIFVDPSLGGSVTGAGAYTYGDTATLTAVANPNYDFTGFSGDLTTTDNPATLVMDGSKSVTANFTLKQYTLVISVSPNGAGGVGGAGAYNAGVTANLSAIPNSLSTFDSWSGDLMSTFNPDTLLIDSNKDVSANFSELCTPGVAFGLFGGVTTPDIVIVDASSAFILERMGSCTLTRRWRIISAAAGIMEFYLSDGTSSTTPQPVTSDGTLVASGVADPPSGVSIGFYPSDLTIRYPVNSSWNMSTGNIQVSCIDPQGNEIWTPNPT